MRKRKKNHIDRLPVVEKPNRKLFRDAQKLMLKTTTGVWTDEYIHETELPVLFAEREGQRTGAQAFYSRHPRKVRIYDEYKSKRALAEDIIHEVRHSWQDKHFPELLDRTGLGCK